MEPVIEIVGLHKTFRSLRRGARRALDGLDLDVAQGQVHGFLGANGSGKTTTLRALLGLVRADSGSMRIFDVPSSDYASIAHRVGAIVESPRFFGNFSGHKTLSLLARAGGVPDKRVSETLTTVGLAERGRDPVKSYSLGMRQRLAVASALLKRPDLLILDEPANGLDPAGIHEMRALLRRLAGEGVTVLISSHLLSEVQQVCDSVTIVSHGRRVTHGPVATVLAGHDDGRYRVRVPDPQLAAKLLGNAVVEDGAVVVSGVSDPARITETLGRQGIWLTELAPIAPDLEQVFLELTSRPVPQQRAAERDVEIELEVSR